MSAAVHQDIHPETFTQRYRGLLAHYRMEGQHIQTGKGNENGDVEQRHHRLKRALDQALKLRGRPDFQDRGEYVAFLAKLFDQLNAGRQARLEEELRQLRRLPQSQLDTGKRVRVTVGPGSTIRVNHNVYSVNSRLIGEVVEVRLDAESLEVWYAQRQVETVPRLRGEGKHRIDYRHLIDWLVRKPGAFENYRYREELFPSSRFRMAYDGLKRSLAPAQASKEYLKILHLAAQVSETAVDSTLGWLIQQGELTRYEVVEQRVLSGQSSELTTDVEVAPVDLSSYDSLLEAEEVLAC